MGKLTFYKYFFADYDVTLLSLFVFVVLNFCFCCFGFFHNISVCYLASSMMNMRLCCL